MPGHDLGWPRRSRLSPRSGDVSATAKPAPCICGFTREGVVPTGEDRQGGTFERNSADLPRRVSGTRLEVVLLTTPSDPLALLRSRSYLVLLVLAAIIGVIVSAVAYFFLALVSKLQGWIFTSLPSGLGFHSEPAWWPILPLMLAGLLVGLTLRYLPGTGGHKPAEGFKAGGAPSPAELPGVVLAALATLSLGVVLGP